MNLGIWNLPLSDRSTRDILKKPKDAIKGDKQ